MNGRWRFFSFVATWSISSHHLLCVQCILVRKSVQLCLAFHYICSLIFQHKGSTYKLQGYWYLYLMTTLHRINHFTVTSFVDLFSQVTPRCIVDLIETVGFCHRMWSSYRLSFLHLYQVYPLYVTTKLIYVNSPASDLHYFINNNRRIDRILALTAFRALSR